MEGITMDGLRITNSRTLQIIRIDRNIKIYIYKVFTDYYAHGPIWEKFLGYKVYILNFLKHQEFYTKLLIEGETIDFLNSIRTESYQIKSLNESISLSKDRWDIKKIKELLKENVSI